MEAGTLPQVQSISIQTRLPDNKSLMDILVAIKEKVVRMYPLSQCIHFDCVALVKQAQLNEHKILADFDSVPTVPTTQDMANSQTKISYVVQIEFKGHYATFSMWWELIDRFNNPFMKADEKVLIARWQFLP